MGCTLQSRSLFGLTEFHSVSLTLVRLELVERRRRELGEGQMTGLLGCLGKFVLSSAPPCRRFVLNLTDGRSIYEILNQAL